MARWKSLGAEAETLKHRRRLEVDAVPLAEPESILEVAVAREHRVVLGFGNRLVAEPFLEAVHLGLHGQEVRKCARRLVEDGPAIVRQAILRQIADGERRRFENGARIGLVESRHHAEQRRFSGAVWPAETDAFAFGDLPGDVVEKHTIAESLGQLGQLDHATLEMYYAEG